MKSGTIIDAIARTLWVQYWADEHDNLAQDDEEHELPWNGGDNLHEVAPRTPEEAWLEAGIVVGRFEERNGIQVDAAWAVALKRDGKDWESLDLGETGKSKEEFGHYLAMEALGSGVCWEDRHASHGFGVPTHEMSYMPEVVLR